MITIKIERNIHVAPDGAAIRPSRRRRLMAVAATALAAAGLAVGVTTAVAGPSPSVTTTNVAFVPLATPFKLFTNKSFKANAMFDAVVIGGKTTVPTNATTVELQVEAGGSVAGTMTFYPEGNVAGGSGQALSWAGGEGDTKTIQENVGLKDSLTFANGTGASKATATIIGYSAQVTDGDISGADGSAGQVLTNSGAGATWGPAGGMSYSALLPLATIAANSTPAASLAVPAGTFEITYITQVNGPLDVAALVECFMYSPEGAFIASQRDSTPLNSVTDLIMQGVFVTNGGNVSVSCDANPGGTQLGSVNGSTLVAIQLSSAHGHVTPL